MLRNGIPRVCFFFFHGSEIWDISLLRNGSERYSKCLLLFLFKSTEFQAFFSSAKWSGTESREFSVPRNSRNSAGRNNCSVYSVFRGIIFLSEIANPSRDKPSRGPMALEGTVGGRVKSYNWTVLFCISGAVIWSQRRFLKNVEVTFGLLQFNSIHLLST